MAEKAEEVNHIASTNRKQRKGNAGAEFTFSFLFYIQSRALCMERCCPHINFSHLS